MVANHNRLHGGMAAGGSMGGMGSGGGMGQGMGPMMHGDGGYTPMPAASVPYQEVPGGARVVFREYDANDVAVLRQHLTERAQRMMADGACPMGMMGMRGDRLKRAAGR